MKRLQNGLIVAMILLVANVATATTIDTIGVFDPLGKWHLRNSNSPGAADITAFAYGAGNWKPVVGDWDGPTVPEPATASLALLGVVSLMARRRRRA